MTTDPFASKTPRDDTSERRKRRFRDFAYYCFGAIAAIAVVLVVMGLLGTAGLLPRPVAAGFLVFVVLPFTATAALLLVAGTVLSVLVRRDLRLYMLILWTVVLFVFWVRRETLGANQAVALIYPVGVVLFSLRWWLGERAEKN